MTCGPTCRRPTCDYSIGRPALAALLSDPTVGFEALVTNAAFEELAQMGSMLE